jgi:hypothetical protein
MSSGLLEPVQFAARAEACMSANACIGCRSEPRSIRLQVQQQGTPLADPLTDGVFSHCGTDAIDLVKVDGEWKIGNSSWTVQKTSCTRHLDGPPPQAGK